MTRYWALRTARNWNPLVLAELESGRLRQGWGYQADQDLRVIRAQLDAGQPLNDAQQDCWRGNRHLLGDQPDGVQPGDLVLVPRFPDYPSFALVRITGGYDYQPITVPGGGFDLGHIREARLVAGPLPIASPPLSSPLRNTLGFRIRMINLDRFGDELEALARGEQGDADSRPAAGRPLAVAAHRLLLADDPDGDGRTNQQVLDLLRAAGIEPAGSDPQQVLRTSLNVAQDLFRLGPGFTWIALDADPDRSDPGMSGRALADEAFRVARSKDRERAGIHYEVLKAALLEDGTLIRGPNQGQTLATALRNARDLFEWLERGIWRWK